MSRTQITACLLPVLCFVLISSIQETYADTTSCPTGQRPATASDVAVQQGKVQAGACYDPNDPSIGVAASDAKAYLRTILCAPDGDNYGGMGPDGTIQGLDGKFAACAATFLKAAKQIQPSVCIREGARTVAKQQQYVARGVIACKSGAGCPHPRGVAIDVNGSNYLQLWNMAPQYGIVFPLRSSDQVHMQPATNNCSGGGVAATMGSATPFSGITNAIQGLFGGQPPPPLPPPPPTPMSPTVQQPLTNAFQQPVQTPVPVSSQLTATSNTTQITPTPVSTALNGGLSGNDSATGSSTPSALDLLNALANPTPTQTQATGSPLALNSALNNVAAQPAPGQMPPSAAYANPGNAVALSPAPNTFVSADMNQNISNVSTNSYAPQGTFAGTILNSMSNMLQQILAILQPFGGRGLVASPNLNAQAAAVE